MPDALGGGAACGFWGSPILLTQKSAMPPATTAFFTAHDKDFGGLWVFGSETVIGSGVMNTLVTGVN